MHCLHGHQLKLAIPFGSHSCDPDQYVKLRHVEQNSEGDMFAACYLESGKFRMKVFDSKKIIANVKISEKFKLEAPSRPMYEMQEPFITCCFLDDY